MRKSELDEAEDYDDDDNVIVQQPVGNAPGLKTQRVKFNPTTTSLKGTVPSVATLIIPVGFDPLIGTTHLFLKQLVEVFEAVSKIETANKYEILDTMGKRIFFAVEETNCCIICCMGTRRCFKFKVTNHLGQPIMFIKRPCSCIWCIGAKCLCDYCGNSVSVTLPDGTLIGKVKQRCALCTPKFSVIDLNQEVQLNISGPRGALCCCCKCRLAGSVEFKIFDKDGIEPQGQIHKEWAGLVHEVFCDADTYGLSFDVNLDPKIKALLLAAALLIDFMYFEVSGSDKKDRNRVA